MKITGGRADTFVRKPDPKAGVILVYGPDGGLVRERADILARTVLDDLNDPFRVVELDTGELKKDPARLTDEVQALAFTGGRRLVRLRQAGDNLTPVFKLLLESGREGALVVVESGELGPRSSLRRLMEGAEGAAAVPCYADDARSLPGVIRETLGAEGLTVSRDAMAYLVSNLGSDRSVTRKELEKLALYMGGKGTVEVDDAALCIGDSGATTMDGLVYAVAGGNAARLDPALQRCFAEGMQPIVILRAVSRHFQKLHLARGHVDAGSNPEAAMKKLRPPVMFKFVDGFRRQLDVWTRDRLNAAFEVLTEAELDCKTTGMPAEAVCSRALMRLTQGARGRR